MVGISAFNGCSELDSITWESKLSANEISWGYGAFANCIYDSLKLKLPNYNTSGDEKIIFSQYFVQDEEDRFCRVDVQLPTTVETIAESTVLPGDTIYYGRMLDNDLMHLSNLNFHYFVVSENVDITQELNQEIIANNPVQDVTVDEFGCVSVSSSCEPGTKFQVVVLYNDNDGDPWYSTWNSFRYTHFTVGAKDFSGGLGTEARPYLIADYGDLLAVATKCNDSSNEETQTHYLNAHYKLIANIDCSILDTAWPGITFDFYGTIDGNGYTISGLTGRTLISYNWGTIKNLTFTNADIGYGTWSGSAYFWSSVICGKNYEAGNISNCVVKDSSLEVRLTLSNGTIYHFSGAICGESFGDISNCIVEHSKIKGANDSSASYYDSVINVGSIIGLVQGDAVIQDCLSHDNDVQGELKHASYDKYGSDNNDSSTAFFRVGGFIGCVGADAKIERCVSNNNTHCSIWIPVVKGTNTSIFGWEPKSFCYKEILEDEFVGTYSTVDSFDNCYCDKTNQGTEIFAPLDDLFFDEKAKAYFKDWSFENDQPVLKAPISSIEIVSNPHKTHYYIGESLNLYGLLVKDCEDSKDNYLNGYKVEGYDPLCSGPQTVKVIYTNGYGTFDDTITIKNPDGTEENAIRVENVIPEAVVITPKDEQYEVGHKLTLSDLSATVYYNNGTVKTFDAEPLPTAGKIYFSNNIQNENSVVQTGTLVHSIEYHYVSYDFAGEPDGMPSSVSFALNVTCPHDTQIIENQSAPTPTEYGYTGDTVCTVCREIIAEGDILEPIGEPEIHQHTYTNWTSFDYEKHVRTCTSCGETEYQKHETQNVIESGTEYIICLHCDYKDKVETIDPPIVSKHEYGEWLGIDDKQHYRTCELCGEQEIAEHNFDVTSEGKVCTDCGYVILPEEPPVPSAVITAENKTSPAGQTIQVKLDLSDNPGFAYLRLTIKYDTDALTLMNAENGSIIKDFDQGVNLMWSADKNATANGPMVTLIFEIDEEAEAGDYPIDIIIRECYDEDYNDVSMEDVDGVITVIDFIYGDVNGDFKVDGKDVLMLRKYLSNYDDDTGMSTVEVSFGSDANGDGITNGKDLLLLRKYMANYDDDLGSSTVVLGPAA